MGLSRWLGLAQPVDYQEIQELIDEQFDEIEQKMKVWDALGDTKVERCRAFLKLSKEKQEYLEGVCEPQWLIVAQNEEILKLLKKLVV